METSNNDIDASLANIERLKIAFGYLINDELYAIGTAWGKPRNGHPEATVGEHIKELEQNLEEMKWRFSEEEYWKLRLLIHSHDLLKVHALPKVPIEHPRSHASLAADFLSQFIDDEDLLNMVRYHDESFALYRQFENKGTYHHYRLTSLCNRIRDWRLFLAFNIIDNCTAGKTSEPVKWFIGEVRKVFPTLPVDESWMLTR